MVSSTSFPAHSGDSSAPTFGGTYDGYEIPRGTGGFPDDEALVLHPAPNNSISTSNTSLYNRRAQQQGDLHRRASLPSFPAASGSSLIAGWNADPSVDTGSHFAFDSAAVTGGNYTVSWFRFLSSVSSAQPCRNSPSLFATHTLITLLSPLSIPNTLTHLLIRYNSQIYRLHPIMSTTIVPYMTIVAISVPATRLRGREHRIHSLRLGLERALDRTPRIRTIMVMKIRMQASHLHLVSCPSMMLLFSQV